MSSGQHRVNGQNQAREDGQNHDQDTSKNHRETPTKPIRQNSVNIPGQISDAVKSGDVIKLKLLLKSLESRQREFAINNADVSGRPVLIYAAGTGHLEMVQALLEAGVNPCLTTAGGRTALHEATRAGYTEVVRALLQQGGRDDTDGLSKNRESKEEIQSYRGHRTSGLALESLATLAHTGALLVNLKDAVGLTPLLVLAESTSLSEHQFTALVKVLIETGAQTNVLHPGSQQTVLFRAVELNALAACQELVGAGVPIDVQDSVGDTVLHLASRLDVANILRFLLDSSRESVNVKNKAGETPLHCAALAGSRQCLNALLDSGGDLSVGDNLHQTALDAIFSHLPRPSSFLLETLDSKVMSNGCGLNDRRFQLTLDFRVLSPDRGHQMAVVVALMNALHSLDRKHILAHPLIETYLRAKWLRMRNFFFGLVGIHLLFVVSLSTYAVWSTDPKDPTSITYSRRVLLGSAVVLMLHLTMQTCLAPRYFLSEAETWVSVPCVALALIVSIAGEVLPRPAGTEELDADWMRHITAITVLLAWGQVIFILGRFPAIGFFALMFFTVFKNVFKVLLISACLVIGFSLSFGVQFNYFGYDGLWRSLLRTTVMLMGEYQYESLFPAEVPPEGSLQLRWNIKDSHLHWTSQVTFVMFVVLGSVVLVNLMIGLAVSDIQGLKAEGNRRHIIKQAEFLFHMDAILTRTRLFKRRIATPSMVTISPNSTHKKTNSGHYNRLGMSIPCNVMEGLVRIALANQRRDSDVTRDDIGPVQTFSMGHNYHSEFDVSVMNAL